MRFLLAATAAFLLLAGVASSAPGDYTIALDNPTPAFGDQVTVTVETTDPRPFAYAECSQAGVVVYRQYIGLYASYRFDKFFTFGPTGMWTGGAADCTATLGYYQGAKFKARATISFTVTA